MICATCHGSGRVMRDSLPVIGAMPGDPTKAPPDFSIYRPCLGCHGSGVSDPPPDAAAGEGKEDCSTCAARNNGTLADYCHHAALAEKYPGDGKPIRGYPNRPAWCPGYIPEEDDFEWGGDA